ncbi:MAG: ribonuclease HII, partial [Bacteroidales bacterium]|nr:ribonuclease HII [Bacteroidales bacterium]
EKQRNELRKIIEEKSEAYGVAFLDNNEIDKINILWASVKAMHLAIDKLNIEPEHLLIDGNKFKPYKKIPHTCVIKGDGKYAPIAAASILAKTYRDEYMEKLHDEFPQYQWNSNKGYPTKRHRGAIEEFGLTGYHRRSFKLTDSQLKLKL